MHYAAELGFLHVTQTLVEKCPGLLALKTREPYKKKQGLLPVELALVTQNDDVAAYLIRKMSHDRYCASELCGSIESRNSKLNGILIIFPRKLEASYNQLSKLLEFLLTGILFHNHQSTEFIFLDTERYDQSSAIFVQFPVHH